MRVGRIELASRRSDHWGEIKTHAYAESFDGQTWLVARFRPDENAELLVLDVLDERPSVLRRIPLPVSEVGSIDLDARYCNLHGGEPFARPERLRYELPSFTLRERSEVALSKKDGESQHAFLGRFALHSDAAPVVWERWMDLESQSISAPRLWAGQKEVELPGDLPLNVSTMTLKVLGSRFGVALIHEQGRACCSATWLDREWSSISSSVGRPALRSGPSPISPSSRTARAATQLRSQGEPPRSRHPDLKNAATSLSRVLFTGLQLCSAPCPSAEHPNSDGSARCARASRGVASTCPLPRRATTGSLLRRSPGSPIA